MPENIPLDPDLIDVLASETRRNILGQLQDRRMTTTELAETLDLGKATVHEHLKKLAEAGLVSRDDDERLWVYYELTPRAKRILNPDRTRLYLAIVSFVAAAAIVALAVFAWSGITAEDPSQTAVDPGPRIVLEDEEAYASGGISLAARGDVSEVDAYLVDEQAARQIRQGDLGVNGLPLRASPTEATGTTEATGERTILRSDASLAPGTYYLYVRSAQGDNAQSMPSVRLAGLEANTARAQFYQGLDEGPWTIDVTREGQPVDGLARLEPAQGDASLVVELVDGQAKVSASQLDRLDPGRYTVSVQPRDARQWIDAGASLDVLAPPVAAQPLHGRASETTNVDVHVTGPERLLQAGLTATGNATVDETESGWLVNLTPQRPREVTLTAGRHTVGVFEAHPAIRLDATVRNGPELELAVSTVSGSPVTDAAVYLDGQALGFTNGSGAVTTELPSEGVHRFTVHRPDGETVHRALQVDGWTLSQAKSGVSIEPVNVSSSPGLAHVTASIDNDLPVPQPVTATGSVDGQFAGSTGTVVPAQATATVNLTLPVQEGRHRIGVNVIALEPGPFAYHNETTSDEQAAGGSGGSADTADSDGDGVPDSEDACPNQAGPESNDGCPVEDAESFETEEGVEVTVGEVEDATARAEDTTTQLEPIQPEAGQDAAAEGGAADQPAETPGVPAGLVALLVLVVAALRRARDS